MIHMFDNLIRKVKSLREQILRCLESEIIASTSHSTEGMGSVELLSALMNLSVSKRSRVKDMIWYFDDEPGTLARDIEGAKSRIDFTKYESLNSTMLFELKMVIMCVLEMPGALRFRKKRRVYKPHSVLDIFKSTIPFINKMCARKRAEHGDHFFESCHFSLSDFIGQDYRVEAEAYDRAFRAPTLQGFNFLRSHFFVETLFSKPMAYIDLEALKWKKNSIINPHVRKKQKWFSNKVFEKSSREGSFAVVDFLRALGEKVNDQDTYERLELMGYCEARNFKLTRKNYDIYVAIRLTSRGYTGEQIRPFLYRLESEYWSPKRRGMLKDKEALCRLTRASMDNDFYEYMTHVSNSASYIVAQYSAMRPSELSGCMAEGCLIVDDDGYDLLLSNVIKERDVYRKLFDDKWVAIPIVKDAVKALQILNRFKQNPYLFSNMNTVEPNMQGSANSLSGNGLAHQLNTFLAKVLTPDELKELDVSPYTLRHSLANQMFRAAVGLPFISYQLKHFGNLVSQYGNGRQRSVTVDYGGIGVALTSGGGADAPSRFEAEKEFIKATCDPDGNYAGDNAGAHRERLASYFKGYLEAGYSREEIFERMAELDFAVINVGHGYCYGNAADLHDPSLPCVGSLRCNPNRCKHAVVTEANAPKWQEVYVQNTLALNRLETAASEPYAGLRESGEVSLSVDQMRLAISEAKGVLERLGISVPM